MDVQNKLARKFCFVQPIEHGASSYVSLDYFPVHIYRLPKIGKTASELLRKIRLDINSFVDNGISEFSAEFSDDETENEQNSRLWESEGIGQSYGCCGPHRHVR